MSNDITLKVLLFELQDKDFAIEIGKIKEIIRNVAGKTIPNQPAILDGVINLRGTFVPLIDLSNRFLLGKLPDDIEHRILICYLKNNLIAIRVNKVYKIESIQFKTDINDCIEAISIKQHFIKGVLEENERIVTLIDIDELLNDIEPELLQIDSIET